MAGEEMGIVGCIQLHDCKQAHEAQHAEHLGDCYSAVKVLMVSRARARMPRRRACESECVGGLGVSGLQLRGGDWGEGLEQVTWEVDSEHAGDGWELCAMGRGVTPTIACIYVLSCFAKGLLDIALWCFVAARATCRRERGWV